MDLKDAVTLKQHTFRKEVLLWASNHLRDYPWRKTGRGPYEILVAELLLKRTTATAVARVYEDFLHQFHSIESISKANEVELVQALSKLGLQWQRAKAVKSLAHYIMNRGGGKIPSSLIELLNVPGLGEYSARAIMSFGFDIPVAVLDGNVARILTRVFQNILPQRPPQRLLQQLAESLLPNKSHRDYNLGLLDLGALICRYVDPLCPECPLAPICDYYDRNKVRLIKEEPERYETAIGMKLRNVRREKGIGLAKLAQLAKVSKLTIIRIESGKASPRPDTIAKLAAVLGEPTDVLTA